MPLTVNQIVDLVNAMRPREAITSHGILSEHCKTSLITEIDLDGEIIQLNLVTGDDGVARYAAAEVRVSGEDQQLDGFSVEEQTLRFVTDCVNKREAFIIYSDAGISGFDPPQDPRLISEMIRKRVARYRANYTAVFLQSATHKYTTAQTLQMTAYMEAQCEKIRRGEPDDANTEADLLPRKRGKVVYRPGLTLLLRDLPHIHTIKVTDLARLYRNLSLQLEIAERLEKLEGRVVIVGLVEDLSYLNKTTFGAKLQSYIFAMMAEQQLASASINALRGSAQMLESGRPYGWLPGFLERDTDVWKRSADPLIREKATKGGGGYAVWKEGARESLLRYIELITTADETGHMRAYNECQRVMLSEGRMCWDDSEKGYAQMPTYLRSRYLLGLHTAFGLEVRLAGLEPLLTEAQWYVLQARLDQIARVADATHTVTEHGEGHLATGLFKCWCGNPLHHRRTGQGRTHTYSCYSQFEKRARKGTHHTSLNYENVNSFLTEMMTRYYDWIAGMHVNEIRHVRLREEHAALSEQILGREAALRARCDALYEEAVESVLRFGYKPTHADFNGLVAKKITLMTEEEAGHIQGLQALVAQLEVDMLPYLGHERINRIREKVAVWDTLSVHERNGILRHFFMRFEVRGRDPDCVIVPVISSDFELPAIILRTTTATTKTGQAKYTRRLPSVNDYYLESCCGIGFLVNGLGDVKLPSDYL